MKYVLALLVLLFLVSPGLARQTILENRITTITHGGNVTPGDCTGGNSTHESVTQNITTSGPECVLVARNPGSSGTSGGNHTTTLPASNISSGVFGENTGAGNYTISTMFFDNTSGRIGIGTTTPSNNLHVFASGSGVNLEFQGDTGGAGLIYSSNAASVDYKKTQTFFSTASLYRIRSLNENNTKGVEGFAVDFVNNGSVGLGDLSPDAKLEVSNDGNVMPYLYVSSDDGDDGDVFAIDESGRVGIGTTSPSELLDVVSSDSGGTFVRVQNNLGTARDVGFKFIQDSTEWNARTDSTGSFVFTQSGTGGNEFWITNTTGTVNVRKGFAVDADTLYVNDSSDNIGIGTNNPSSRLHVLGDSVFTAHFERETSTNNALLTSLFFTTQTTSSSRSDGFGPALAFTTKDSGSSSSIGDALAIIGAVRNGADDSGDFVVLTRNQSVSNEVMRVTAQERVGIGTTSPKETLDVEGNVTFNSGTFFVDASSNNVGMGTQSPTAPLHVSLGDLILTTNPSTAATFQNVEAANQNTGMILSLIGGNGTNGNAQIGFGDLAGEFRGRVVYSNGGSFQDAMRFFTNNTAKMTIRPTGEVGIGTTTPTAQLEVQGEVEITDTNTGSNAGTDLCIDANNKLCRCGSCA